MVDEVRAPSRVRRAILGGGRSRSLANIEQALETAPPADHIRRRSVRPDDLDDLAVTIFIALMAALDRQLVPDLCLHDEPPRRCHVLSVECH
jgi:hypothetical protein